LRNVKAQHEAEIMAADERAARRWADQAERMRQLHEQEKIEICEREKQRAKERVEKHLEDMEKETNLIRERSV
jgi:5-azacytidine-induced protein 1